jgi:hypothetical protein
MNQRSKMPFWKRRNGSINDLPKWVFWLSVMLGGGLGFRLVSGLGGGLGGGLIVGLIVVWISGLISGLISERDDELGFGLIDGLVYRVMVGLVVGLVVGLISGLVYGLDYGLGVGLGWLVSKRTNPWETHKGGEAVQLDVASSSLPGAWRFHLVAGVLSRDADEFLAEMEELFAEYSDIEGVAMARQHMNQQAWGSLRAVAVEWVKRLVERVFTGYRAG